ncbi:MAG: NosD domain-containing protein [Thermoplasmata archaeon]
MKLKLGVCVGIFCWCLMLSIIPSLTPAENSIMSAHSPIYIDGNSNFTYANGVVGGTGTQTDPFVIQNWEIDCTDAHGIWITNTTLYFVIRNVVISAANTSSFYGIYLTNLTNGVIENVTVKNAASGVNLAVVKNCMLSSLYVTDCSIGVAMFDATNTELRDSRIQNNTNYACMVAGSDSINLKTLQVRDTGLRLVGVNNSEISGSTIETENSGVTLEDCYGISVVNNAFTNTSILLIGETNSAYNTHTIDGNTVNGKTVLYIKNQSGQTISGTYGEIILASSSDSTISNVNMADGDVLIEVALCQRINISSINLKSANYGVYAIGSTTVRITSFNGNELNNGIIGLECTDLSIENSKFEGCHIGFSSVSSAAITISRAVFENNTYGCTTYQGSTHTFADIYFGNNTQAVSLMSTKSTRIQGSKFIKNDVGLKFAGSNQNIITGNVFMATTHYAILLDSTSENNTINENAFLFNHIGGKQALDNSGKNLWYNGARGNFWDDWTKPDTNNDTIVDIPYSLEGTGNASDNYPLTTSPYPQIMDVEIFLSSPEIYVFSYTTFSISVTTRGIPLPNAFLEFSQKIGNVTAGNYTDENGIISGTYSSGGTEGVENISIKLMRAGFVSKTTWIEIHVLAYPSLQVSVFPQSSVVYSGGNTTVVVVVHSGEQPVEDAMVSFNVEPYATLSESIKPTDANGTVIITVYFPVVENQTVFILCANATKNGYNEGSGWAEITVNPKKTLEINVTCNKKIPANTSTEINLTVTSEKQSVPGVNISLSSDMNCTFLPQSGITDQHGRFSTTLTIPKINFDTIVKIYIYATKDTFADAYVEVEIYTGNPPSTPRNLVGDGKDGKVVLKWDESPGTTLYYIYRSETPGTNFVEIGNTTVGGFEDKHVINGHTYYYRIRAYNEFGTSEWSNEVGVTPHAPMKITPGFDTPILFLAFLASAGIFIYRRIKENKKEN